MGDSKRLDILALPPDIISDQAAERLSSAAINFALGTRRPILVPDRANQRWSLDFVSDAFADGQRFR
ncbi:hypothetical protein, partial [uncultured Tateyamaria sp.]|uniref:hypothetical protein n=1 Tax=uncultured Tateyamaria sp. TaxID=455651 RepID=UPI0026048272